ncbi:DUF6317 family protein [Streptomyces sp. DW26H14]|uniref:DUF6317 family protein n=1 Tax=Streptomyces sp. DW26H14 TaxID=3435395 RepID=UPI00403E095B
MSKTNVQLVEADLSGMAATFKKESKACGDLHAKLKPAVAKSGDPGLDESIKAMWDLIAGLHDTLTDRIADHGDKLQYAHDSFHRNDVDIHGVFEDLDLSDE